MDDVFDPGTFDQLNLHPDVLRGVKEMGFEHPTDIQAKLIPRALEGLDIIGQAKTGTGKTAAFGLPILQQADPHTPMQALILVPTRELAAQVASELESLGRYTPIRTACIIGGESMRQQIRHVQEGGHILVGTPGRVMDLQGRRQISFDHIRFVVLDEVDRMLDIGFRDDIRRILSQIRCDHQTVFVSATVDKEIEFLARRFMKPEAIKIETSGDVLTVSQVDQKYIAVEPWDKQALLKFLLKHEEPETTVIFCRTKITVHKVAMFLRGAGIEAREIHGDMHQSKRSKVMDSMRKGKLDVLVASDLAARGLDIEHISHVINYDLPEDPEVYIHRIGRTARAGRRGNAWSFVTPEQGGLLTDIEKLAGVMIEQWDYPQFKPGPVPSDVIQERSRHARPASQDVPLGERLASRATPAPTAELSDAELAAKFPSGVIPSDAPKRTLGRRLRSSRKR